MGTDKLHIHIHISFPLGLLTWLHCVLSGRIFMRSLYDSLSFTTKTKNAHSLVSYKGNSCVSGNVIMPHGEKVSRR